MFIGVLQFIYSEKTTKIRQNIQNRFWLTSNLFLEILSNFYGAFLENTYSMRGSLAERHPVTGHMLWSLIWKHWFFFQPEDWPYVNQKQFPFVHALVIPESEEVAILPEKTGSGYKAQKLALLSQVGGKNFGGNGQILATFTVEKSMIVITFLMRKPCR